MNGGKAMISPIKEELNDTDKLCLGMASKAEKHPDFLGYIISGENHAYESAYLRIYSSEFLGEKELESGLFTTSFKKAIRYDNLQIAQALASTFMIKSDVYMLFYIDNKFDLMGLDEQKETLRTGKSV